MAVAEIVKLNRGTPLAEMAAGSYNTLTQQIRRDFYHQFPDIDDVYWVTEIFADYLIVNAESLAIGQFYQVGYTMSDGRYEFVDREDWALVELAYQPITLTERLREKKGQKIVETSNSLKIAEAEEGRPRRVFIDLAEADVINRNGRRYSLSVLVEAVADARHHLEQSLSQGRAILLGEDVHPSSKGQSPRFTETIVKWTDIYFDSDSGWVKAEGEMIPNSIGQDAIINMDHGVYPGVSLRGYGESKLVKEDGQSFDDIQWLRFTGIDFEMQTGFDQAGVTHMENYQGGTNNMASKDKTPTNEATAPQSTPLSVAALREQNPELVQELLKTVEFEQKLEEEDKRKAAELREEELKKFNAKREAALRDALGIGETDDLQTAVAENAKRKAELEEAEAKRAVAGFIEGEISSIKEYPDHFREALLASVQADTPSSVEEAKASVSRHRKVHDKLVAKHRLQLKGFGIHAAPVFESETGVPAYARAAWEITEAMKVRGLGTQRDYRNASKLTPAERFTVRYLEAYDEMNQAHLREESSLMEANSSSDFNLPYTAIRVIIDQVFPNLVAANIFDFQMAENNPMRIYFRQSVAGETGYSVDVSGSSNVNAAAFDTWYTLAAGHKRLVFSSLVLAPNAGGAALTYGTDYLVNLDTGEYMLLSSGGGATATAYDLDYTYKAMRKGEGATIERMKTSTEYVDVAAIADRLATLINDEAIRFASSQLGMDAPATNLNLLVKEMRTNIERNLILKGINKALTVASNTTAWNSSSGTKEQLVAAILGAKSKVRNRYYEVDSITVSETRSNDLILWEGFTAEGTRNGFTLENTPGYLGTLANIPVFMSTEIPDQFILVNDKELVQHRTWGTMSMEGPFHVRHETDGKLIAAKEYYVQEYNANVTPIAEKGSVVIVS